MTLSYIYVYRDDIINGLFSNLKILFCMYQSLFDHGYYRASNWDDKDIILKIFDPEIE